MTQLLGAGYHFKRIQLLKDQELGCGSYGMVCKALCDELLCAAKLLHPVIVSERNVQKFHQECQILSGLKHPNIIQYLGTLNDGPTSCQILLMELMEESLTSFLERSTPPLPFHTEVNLCRDISLALAYLHFNDIIHRDLSSNNVLLTSDKRAKITDFGMSRLANTSARLSTLTQAPGCSVYMSPEALAHTPKYSRKLDIFSMGVLIIQILTCKFPSPGSPRKKVVDKRYPRPIEVPVIDTERRKTHIDLVEPTHPLLKHACACLSYEDEDRPTAQEMCHHMLELEKNDRYLKAKCDSKETLEQLKCHLQKKLEELAERDEVISRKDKEISKIREDLSKADEDISSKNMIISEKDKEIVKKDELLQTRDQELAQKELLMYKVEQDLSKKEELFCTLKMEMRASLEEFKNKFIKKENDQETIKDKVAQFVENLLQIVEEKLVAMKVKSMSCDVTDGANMKERESTNTERDMEMDVGGSDVDGGSEVDLSSAMKGWPQPRAECPPQQQETTLIPLEATPQQQESTPLPQVATSQQQEETTPQQLAGHAVDPSHVFIPEWSTLPKEEVVDKVKGTIYGQAIGDAIGLATEFMTKKQAAKVYPKGLSGYEDIRRDAHRSRWAKGDWTDDTDQMLLILKGIVDHNGDVDRLDFAKRLYDWMERGFPELGDYVGMGIGMTVHNTLTHEEFLKDPHTAAKDVWKSSGCTLAANGAIMRTSILGLLDFNDLSKVIKNTVEICAVTHADPRCAASCVAMTTALALMLQGKYDAMKEKENKSLVEEALEHAFEFLPETKQRKEMDKHIKASLKNLKLDESSSIGYTFKALGAGFYGLRKATDFRKTIMKLIMEGGDADTNGAVCGALMGCKFGFKALPQDLLQFKNRQWLDERVESFLTVMGLL